MRLSAAQLATLLEGLDWKPQVRSAEFAILQSLRKQTDTLPEDQMLLGLEDVEQVAASKEAENDAANPAAPIASEALERIAGLYAIQKEIRGRRAEERYAVRQNRSRPIIDDLEPWLRTRPQARRSLI